MTVHISGTNQEIFDRVVTHLANQKHPAMAVNMPWSMDGGYPVCCYRTPEGESCSIGCLIPDDEYDFIFEGKRITSLINSGYISIKGVSKELLSKLQSAHDGSVDAPDLIGKLKNIARNFDLDDGKINLITEWSLNKQ